MPSSIHFLGIWGAPPYSSLPEHFILLKRQKLFQNWVKDFILYMFFIVESSNTSLISGIYFWDDLMQKTLIFLLRSWVLFQLCTRVQNSFLYGINQVSELSFLLWYNSTDVPCIQPQRGKKMAYKGTFNSTMVIVRFGKRDLWPLGISFWLLNSLLGMASSLQVTLIIVVYVISICLHLCLVNRGCWQWPLSKGKGNTRWYSLSMDEKPSHARCLSFLLVLRCSSSLI